jgi:hypothetical protein
MLSRLKGLRRWFIDNTVNPSYMEGRAHLKIRVKTMRELTPNWSFTECEEIKAKKVKL